MLVGSSVRRALSETVISVAAVAVLILALAASDERVRDQLTAHLSSRPAAEIASAGVLAKDVAMIVFQAARDQSIAHAPLVVFIVVAGVLVLFMLRT
jgi:hypothetical protein